mmetsp:Transcript_16467/g.23001  ORF Transcript_16467/g.23001 Transcript_16467/m.23001 type:complete len:417 (+) Transcript_16467:72-1322(+)
MTDKKEMSGASAPGSDGKEGVKLKRVPRPILDFACQLWFGTWIVVFLLILRFLLSLIHSFKALTSKSSPQDARSEAQRLCNKVAIQVFRAAIVLSPWMRINWRETRAVDDKTSGKKQKAMTLQEACEAVGGGKDGGPTVIFMNHCSFIDSLVAAVKFAEADCGDIRFLMVSSLFDIPLWGEMCRLIGHFPVHAVVNKKGSVANPLGHGGSHEDFRINKELQKKETELMASFLKPGKGLCIYPEGTINRQVRKGERVTSLLPFRYGGIGLAMQYKMKAVALIACGCEEVWPWGSPIGGVPGEVDLVAIPVGDLVELGETAKAASGKLQELMEREAVALYAERGDRDGGNLWMHASLGSALLVFWGIMIGPLTVFFLVAMSLIGLGHALVRVSGAATGRSGGAVFSLGAGDGKHMKTE